MRARVGAIGFSGQAADTPVANLSGGEKARLLLGLATFDGPHLVVLDEPTNHLDIDSRAALIEAINDYPGAVVLVSHDRYLLEACVDRLWLVADGKVTPFDGDLDDYRKLVLAGGENIAADRASERGSARPGRAELRRVAAEKRVESPALQRQIKTAEATMAAPCRAHRRDRSCARRSATLRARRLPRCRCSARSAPKRCRRWRRRRNNGWRSEQQL